tara:strand:+ start:536 stop:952 length:417 start_codon:yes stop_codon:yes gene_type:complete
MVDLFYSYRREYFLLTYIQIAQLFAFALLMSLGQILFKKTAMSLSNNIKPEDALGLTEGIIKAMSTPWLYCALFTYGLATIFWLYILQRIPLPLAYPFSALAMVIVPVAATFIFGDKLTWSYWLGVCLIFSGIVVIAR